MKRQATIPAVPKLEEPGYAQAKIGSRKKGPHLPRNVAHFCPLRHLPTYHETRDCSQMYCVLVILGQSVTIDALRPSSFNWGAILIDSPVLTRSHVRVVRVTREEARKLFSSRLWCIRTSLFCPSQLLTKTRQQGQHISLLHSPVHSNQCRQHRDSR